MGITSVPTLTCDDCNGPICDECSCCVDCNPGHVDGCYGILDDALRAVDYLVDVYSSEDDPHNTITVLLKEAESALKRMLEITRHQSGPRIDESVGRLSGNA